MTIDPGTLPVLCFGSRGGAVTAAKMAINEWNVGRDANETPLYGPFFGPRVKRFQRYHGLPADGIIGARTWTQLLPYMDAAAKKLLPAPPLTLCYPHPAGHSVYVGQGLHETEGLPGNWAIDFMAPGGTAVLASCAAKVTRFSGHDPATGVHNGDIFGWSIYLEDAAGRTYYLTHLGTRDVHVGDRVKVVQKIGTVGHWPGNPARSHTHEGVTSLAGSAQAKQRIIDISKATRLPAV